LFVRNGKTASDLRDIVEAGPLDAWVEYVCAADVGADAKVPGGAATFAGRTTATVTLSDYRHHSSDTGLAAAVARDLSSHRVALVREHVLSLGPKDALAFETRGELTASVDVDWSDIFTSEIGLLTRLLDARGPIAIETTSGATCSAKVSVTDSFLVAFARGNQDGSLLVAVRKGEVRKTDIGAGLSIGVAIDDRGAVERLVDEMLDKIGLGALREPPVPVPDIRARVVDAIEDVAKTKIAAAFEYEYQRVDSAATVFEATIAPGQLSPALHAALVCGNLAPALSAPPSVITISRYLNDRTATVSRAWGFTLGIGKWQVFGRDRRRLTRVVRFDATRQVEQRSYIGSGGYERTHLEWMVDFKAGMRGWAAAPVVADFDLGLHVAWIRDLRPSTPAISTRRSTLRRCGRFVPTDRSPGCASVCRRSSVRRPNGHFTSA